MITHTTYLCELCGFEDEDRALVAKCEASGWPDPIPWIQQGDRIPAFGEQGVKWGTVIGCQVGCASPYDGGHGWRVVTAESLFLSHNIGDDHDGRSNRAVFFDPRGGWDAFRYTTEGADVWVARAKEIGITREELVKKTEYHPALRAELDRLWVPT